MLNAILIVYAVAVALTWAYAGYLTGRQFQRVIKTADPRQNIQINWISVFFQGLVWVAFWASFVGEKIEKRT